MPAFSSYLITLKDEASDPAGVSPFGGKGTALAADDVADLIEQPGLLSCGAYGG